MQSLYLERIVRSVWSSWGSINASLTCDFFSLTGSYGSMILQLTGHS